MHIPAAIFLALLLLGSPPGAAAQNGFNDDGPNQQAGRVADSEAFAMPDLPGQEQAAKLRRQYAAAIKERLAEIRLSIDPTYTEQLQKEISDLKAEEEKAQMELQLEFALQNGDESRAVQLQKELGSFYREKVMVPDDGEPEQTPEMSTMRRWTKNPDDS